MVRLDDPMQTSTGEKKIAMDDRHTNTHTHTRKMDRHQQKRQVLLFPSTVTGKRHRARLNEKKTNKI